MCVLFTAVYIPPKKQKLNVFRKNWNNQNNPASEQRLKIRKVGFSYYITFKLNNNDMFNIL